MKKITTNLFAGFIALLPISLLGCQEQAPENPFLILEGYADIYRIQMDGLECVQAS